MIQTFCWETSLVLAYGFSESILAIDLDAETCTFKKFYNPGSGINVQYRIVNLLSFPVVILLNGS